MPPYFSRVNQKSTKYKLQAKSVLLDSPEAKDLFLDFKIVEKFKNSKDNSL